MAQGKDGHFNQILRVTIVSLNIKRGYYYFLNKQTKSICISLAKRIFFYNLAGETPKLCLHQTCKELDKFYEKLPNLARHCSPLSSISAIFNSHL